MSTGRQILLKCICRGIIFYYVTSLVVLMGLALGTEYVQRRNTDSSRADLVSACIRFDGIHYRTIAENGYEYHPAKRSTVAFFPAYPLLSRAFSQSMGIRLDVAMIFISNLFLCATFCALAIYDNIHSGIGPWTQTGWTLVAFGLWPCSFFFRMAYAESLFLFTTVIFLIGMRARWPLVTLALVAGAATATRPVGVALTAAFLWYSVSQPASCRCWRVGRAVALAPLACWGLLGYIAFQYLAFGNGFAFVQTQQYWTFGRPALDHGLMNKLARLVTLEPIWGVYDPSSSRNWYLADLNNDILFNLSFWNPIVFLSSAALISFGAFRKWLTASEIVLGTAILAIPYLTRAYEMSMSSHARFASATVVIYPVLGKSLASWSSPNSALACAVSAALLLCWSALFAAGYLFF